MTNILARIKSLGYAAAVTSGINKLNVLMHACKNAHFFTIFLKKLHFLNSHYSTY